jgi:anthranilate phosphoribosyltransferase
VHGADGLDEITTAHTDAAWLEAGRVRRLRIDPGARNRARPEGYLAATRSGMPRSCAVLGGRPGATSCC